MVAAIKFNDKRGIDLKLKRDITNKPYYRCFRCERFRNECGGMPTRDMTIQEWSEYIRDIRDYFGLTNEYITEKAESSSGTTERIMAGNPKQDIMRATARRYEQAVIGPVGHFTCYLDYDHETEDQVDVLLAEVATLREEVFYWRTENDRKAKIIDKLLG
jgi:hypothetical protein